MDSEKYFIESSYTDVLKQHVDEEDKILINSETQHLYGDELYYKEKVQEELREMNRKWEVGEREEVSPLGIRGGMKSYSVQYTEKG